MQLQYAQKPNRLTSKKDEKYHLEYATWCFNNSRGDSRHYAYLYKNAVNLTFYKGDQWIFEEDQEAFFLDYAGNHRNRIKVTQNIIKPIVKYLEAIVIQSSFSAWSRCSDDRVISRRDQEVLKVTALKRISAALPDFADAIKKNNPMVESEDPEREIMASLSDYLEVNTNRIIKHLQGTVDLDEVVRNIAKYMAVCGIGIYKGYDHNGIYTGSHIHPNRFNWDKNAIKLDLSDAEYMGEVNLSTFSRIAELYPNVSIKDLQEIEESITRSGTTNHFMMDPYVRFGAGRVPVVEQYWIDTVEMEYAWVYDKYGNLLLTNVSEDSEYKDAKRAKKSDLTDTQLDTTGGEVSTKIKTDEVRFCEFIPITTFGIMAGGDIVLDYGVLPYAERDGLNPLNAKFPYVVYCWDMEEGEVMSPVDDVINPQRMINRILSVQESMLNSSHNSGPVLDKRFVASQSEDEDEVLAKIARGEPLIGDMAMGAPNAVGRYESNMGDAVFKIQATLDIYGRGIERTTGVNSAMIGTDAASTQLSGVFNGRIAQGNLIQVPFMHGIKRLVKGITSQMGNVGRRIFADNPSMLSRVIGDDMVPVMMTKEMSLEEMRFFIEVTESERTEIEKANGILISLLTAGIVPDSFYGECFNRVNINELADKLREFLRKKAIADSQANQAAMQGAQQDRELLMKQYEDEYNFRLAELMQRDKQAAEKNNTSERMNIRSIQAKREMKGLPS